MTLEDIALAVLIGVTAWVVGSVFGTSMGIGVMFLGLALYKMFFCR